jgi:diadenosine tetraphosphate (Ap4A) HIT family hydrolase
MDMFELDPRLENDTLFVMDLPLCRVLLMNNRDFPWLVLVPRRQMLAEITDMNAEDRAQWMHEVCTASMVLQAHTKGYKMNVAALGNIVRQLHTHVIARHEGDAAWPHPVWGRGGQPYAEEEAQVHILALRELLRFSDVHT